MTTKFKDRIEVELRGTLKANAVEVMQVNLTYQCNLACTHCHIGAGPTRTEMMSASTVDMVLSVLATHKIPKLDITGGAPELNPEFKRLITEAQKLGTSIMTRTNLSIFFESGMEDLPKFLADNKVEITASQPCYTKDNVDSVRGSGTYELSIKALKMLNTLGYGGKLPLNLVYNPGGAFLAGEQCKLELDYKRELFTRHGIIFTSLFAFSNAPIGRFKDFLTRSAQLEGYTCTLHSAFNPATLEGLMCRSLISVAPDGKLYDCDFNQAEGLALSEGVPAHISEFDYDVLAKRPIAVDEHCHVCTAGQGST